jgi:hypothetical protein
MKHFFCSQTASLTIEYEPGPSQAQHKVWTKVSNLHDAVATDEGCMDILIFFQIPAQPGMNVELQPFPPS